MKFNYSHKAIFLLLCATLVACNKSDLRREQEVQGKEPIVLSVGGVDSQSETKAVITDGTDKTMQNFDVNTKIFMIMKSEYVALPSPYEELNFGGSQTTKYTVSRGDVTANTNTVVFDGKNQRYWDDAHARSSKLNIWAYAQKGMSWTTCYFGEDDGDGGYRQTTPPGFDTNQKIDWRTNPIYPIIFNWKASHRTGDDANKQDQTTVMCQDLLFSNNLVNNSSTGTDLGGIDGRLAFDPARRKFPEVGNALMKFYHAMSKITIQIVEGDGFDTSSTADFQFKSGTNVKLSQFNTEGLFSIQMGGFQQINNHVDIPSIYLKTPSPTVAPYYTLEALAVPNIDDFMQTYVPAQHDEFSRFVSGRKDYATDIMMEFIIDDNKYQITSGQLYDALHEGGNPANALVANATEKTNNGTYIPLEAGKNYVFTFTIGKQKIDHITAEVADWIDVIATGQTPENAYVTVSVKTGEGSSVTGAPTFDLYRAPGTSYSGPTTVEGYNAYADYNWEKGYEKSSGLAETALTPGIYTTEWYWPNNNTYYHLRTVSPTSEAISGNDATTYVSMTGGVIKAGSVTAKDYIWGAPFTTSSPNPDNYSFNYGYCNSATKADGQLYKAIGATKDNITLIQHHMTSQVFVDLENDTTVDVENRVNLAGATVQLINIAQDAQLYLGNGLITTYSNFGNVGMTPDAHAAASPIPAYDYSYGVLPQILSNTGGNVGLKITAVDGNVYIIDDIRTIKTGGNYITEWLPGRKYFYKFVLKKTGITNLSATIVNWENVVAGEEDITIK